MTVGALRRSALAALAAIAFVAGSAASADAAAPLDSQTLHQWAKDTFGKAWSERRFSGLGVAVVQGGRVELSEGFGFADYATGAPVDPERTRFQIASVTKTFAALAVAQLVDRGLIKSLDDPVNKYLRRARLPDVDGKAVTIWNLLTHRGGFEDHLVRLGNLDGNIAVPATADEIESLLPSTVREPGTLSVYSNFAVGMLGVLVEDITAMTLADYMRRNIFEPLGMHETELSYSASPASGLGQPYAFFPDGSAQKIAHLSIRPFFAAGGGIVTTVHDMALYMNAQLDAGRGESARILSRHMFEVMHAPRTANHPGTDSLGMLFVVSHWGGETLLRHSGGWPGWYSVMILLPERGVGYFATVMSDAPIPSLWERISGRGRMTPGGDRKIGRAYENSDLSRAFTDTFLGPRLRVDRFADAQHVDELAGTYWRERRSFSRADVMFEIADPEASVLRVDYAGNGQLFIDGRGPYRAISASSFGLPAAKQSKIGNLSADLADIVAFSRTADGRSLLLPGDGVSAFTRVGAFANPVLVSKALAVALPLAVTGLLALGWGGQGPLGRVGRCAAIGLALAALAAFAVIFLGFADGDGWRFYKLSGRAARFVALGVLGNLGFALSALIAALAPFAWIHGSWGQSGAGLVRRLHFSLLAIAGLLIIWVLVFTRLIGWRLPI